MLDKILNFLFRTRRGVMVLVFAAGVSAFLLVGCSLSDCFYSVGMEACGNGLAGACFDEGFVTCNECTGLLGCNCSQSKSDTAPETENFSNQAQDD